MDISDISSSFSLDNTISRQLYEFGFKYILLGNINVGKTSILQTFIYNKKIDTS